MPVTVSISSTSQDFFSQMVFSGKLELGVCLGSCVLPIIPVFFQFTLQTIHLQFESNVRVLYSICLCTPIHSPEPHFYTLHATFLRFSKHPVICNKSYNMVLKTTYCTTVAINNKHRRTTLGLVKRTNVTSHCNKIVMFVNRIEM